jgi:hypothetical protein
MRQRAFRRSERGSTDRLLAYFRAVFIDGPFRDASCPSLVHVDDDGEINGFLGVLTRRMRLRGQLLLVGVGTQLMVEPNAGLAARRLVRAMRDGAQDITFADTANEGARRLWLANGGRALPVQSLSWTIPLRPWRHAIGEAGRRLVSRAAVATAAPFAGLADNLMHAFGAFVPPKDGSRTEPLSPQLVRRYSAEVLSEFELRPEYDASFEFVWAGAEEKRQFGKMHGFLVRDAEGLPLGWCLYYFGATRVAEVVQIAAKPRDASQVLSWLVWDARRRGATAVSGRAEPWLLAALGERRAWFERSGPFVLWFAHDLGVADAVSGDHAYFSRLDGEWWLSF